MDTKNIKDEQIRKQIITASEVYRDKLAGRVFLYVYGESYFEVVFPTDRFRHLTGVNSSISAQEFYDKAKSSMLSAGQIFYDREHTYRGAKRKLPCLTMLPALTNNVVCVVKDMKTVTLTYKIGVTNLDFTIGLSENLDLEGNKINDWFLPRTLRVKDKAIESSADAEFIDFIFSKDASVDKYSTMTYADKDKKPPRVQISTMDFCTLFFCQRSRWATQERRLNCSRVVSPLRFEALRGAVDGFYKGLLNLVHLQCP